MDEKRLWDLLEDVKKGRCEIKEAVQTFKKWPAEMMEFACLDHHRHLRTGFPEVVYAENKSVEQLLAILRSLRSNGVVTMATRVSSEKAAVILRELPELIYHEQARMITGGSGESGEADGKGTVLVVSAGTSDIPVAEEAVITARCLGNRVDTLYDVGIAGVHRLLAHQEKLNAASVVVVVAGMEGALPSVIGGLVARPVIAVPTSVGYGVSFGGIAALLGMLSSCTPGVAVVNIDNGFGAGCMAAAINRR